MLQTVILETEEPMSLSIGDADPDELLIVKNFSGLTAADVVLFTGDFSKEGGYYQGRRNGRRNPVLTLKLNPNYADDIDVSDIRDMLYQNFLEPLLDDDGVQIRLVDDRRPDRYLICYTETMPTDVFSKTTDVQISMICVDPYLLSVDTVNEVAPGDGYLSFPLEYAGSAKIGMTMLLTITSDTDYVYLANGSNEMVMYGPFLTGDTINLNTILRQRFIEVNGIRRIAVLQAGSKWLTLRRGTNALAVTGDGHTSGLVAITEYGYQEAWHGI